MIKVFKNLEASRGAGVQVCTVTINATGCRFDLHLGQNAVLSSATQHAMPPKFGSKWEMECLDTRIPVPCCVRDKKNYVLDTA